MIMALFGRNFHEDELFYVHKHTLAAVNEIKEKRLHKSTTFDLQGELFTILRRTLQGPLYKTKTDNLFRCSLKHHLGDRRWIYISNLASNFMNTESLPESRAGIIESINEILTNMKFLAKELEEINQKANSVFDNIYKVQELIEEESISENR